MTNHTCAALRRCVLTPLGQRDRHVAFSAMQKTWFAILVSVDSECDLHADLLILELGPHQYCIVRVRELRALSVIMRPETPETVRSLFWPSLQ